MRRHRWPWAPTQTVSGTLSPGTTTAVNSFLGAVGQHVFIDLQQASGDQVSYELVGPDGLQIFGASSSGDLGPVTLTEAGTYDLLIEGASSSSIGYRFRITDTAYSTISFGTPVNGSLSPASATDVYSLAGTAGERVYFHQLSQSSGVNGAYETLYGPDGFAITSTYSGSDFAATLPTDGQYTLLIANNTAGSSFDLQPRGVPDRQSDHRTDPRAGGERDDRAPIRPGELRLQRHDR